VLRVIEEKGLLEVASALDSNLQHHASRRASGLIENNPAANLDGIIAPPVKTTIPALPLEKRYRSC
jgi:hypothetical protein